MFRRPPDSRGAPAAPGRIRPYRRATRLTAPGPDGMMPPRERPPMERDRSRRSRPEFVAGGGKARVAPSARLWPMLLGVLLALVAAALTPASALAATRTWTGAAADGDWTEPANWGGLAPVAGDDLVFPAGALRLTNTNNFP